MYISVYVCTYGVRLCPDKALSQQKYIYIEREELSVVAVHPSSEERKEESERKKRTF